MEIFQTILNEEENEVKKRFYSAAETFKADSSNLGLQLYFVPNKRGKFGYITAYT